MKPKHLHIRLEMTDQERHELKAIAFNAGYTSRTEMILEYCHKLIAKRSKEKKK